MILFKAEASAWTPARCSSSRCGSTRRPGGAATRSAALRDLCRLLLERDAVGLPVRPAENASAIALYEAIGMHHVLDYRSVIL